MHALRSKSEEPFQKKKKKDAPAVPRLIGQRGLLCVGVLVVIWLGGMAWCCE
jgi:hypothetical protein